MNRRIEDKLYHLLSDHWTLGDTVPATGLVFHFRDGWPDLANPHNDGHELWIGTLEQWHTHFNRHEAHRLAWWILWNWWGKGEWFGLKRAAWYWLLMRRVRRVVTPEPDYYADRY